jgi:hypothetical protein
MLLHGSERAGFFRDGTLQGLFFALFYKDFQSFCAVVVPKT